MRIILFSGSMNVRKKRIIYNHDIDKILIKQQNMYKCFHKNTITDLYTLYLTHDEHRRNVEHNTF